MTTISVVGIGKLGSTMLSVFVGAGYHVIGVDINPDLVQQINDGNSPFPEPGVQEYLNANPGRYRATQDGMTAALESDVSVIITQTPSRDDGGFSLQYVLNACGPIAEAIKEKADYHLVVVTSTVMPSHMRQVRDYLEQQTGKTLGEGFGLVYLPEFIRQGSIAHDFENPDYVLVGVESEHDAALVQQVYGPTYHNDPTWQIMNWANAEIAKIAQNAYITTKITFANQLSKLCGSIPGANVDTVTKAIGNDHRIGHAYLTGGTSYGGPCFPRDNWALRRSAEEHDVGLPLADLVDDLNRKWTAELTDIVIRQIQPGDVVGIIGMAFKSGTPVIEESASIKMTEILHARGEHVIYYDNWVSSSMAIEDCIEASDIIVLMHPDVTPLVGLPVDLFKDKIIIDPWRIASYLVDVARDYVPMGVGPEVE